ncbi:tripartite motif-containing protein 3-like [Amia ocellicauda]|uniref:tripartite motif-containing protein 3-like n=1 Tax=Amia ocellicauda TaxID=2972642 RepID=UPI003464C880
MSLNLLHKVVKAESAAFRYRVQIRFALDYCNEKQTLLDKIVQNSFDEKQQLAGLSLALEHLVNNASDMELLSQRQTLMQLEACAPQNQFLCTARTSGDVCTGAQMTESSRSLTPPGFWHFPSCSEENNNFSGLFRHSSSEMNLTIPSPVRQMHIQGRSHDHLVCPTGVAVTHDGFVFITDRGRQRVQVLDSSGDMLGFFRKTTETDSTELGSPAGIAISSLGYLVVIAEPHQRRVSVHARDGRRLFSLRLNWQWPFGVALNSKGQIVVTDNCENGNLYIVTVDWTNGSVLQLQTVESLKYPCFVACSKKDEIAVAINNSVRLYNTAGSLIWTSTPEQGNNCALICPKGIAIDKNSNLIVSDYSSGKVVLLSSEGRWLMNIVSSGLKGPQGLALSPNGLLVIADSQNHTIQMHSYQPASNAATSI